MATLTSLGGGPELIRTLTAGITATNNTSVQNWFGATTPGASVEASTTYIIEGQLIIVTSGTGNTNLSISVGGTATLTSCNWLLGGVKAAAFTLASLQHVYASSGSGAALGVANTSPHMLAVCQGILRVNAAGTLIPQFTFGTTAPGGTSTIREGTFFSLKKIGTSSVAAVGSWS